MVQACETPKEIDLWDYLIKNLGCNLIVDNPNDRIGDKVMMVAYSQNNEDNMDLYDLYGHLKRAHPTYDYILGLDDLGRHHIGMGYSELWV